ncbi:MAG TPA: hypothetical protein VN578_21400 [Candidatus Binatia bacterium]|jgi:hypothetical protein|nr:hypothetical protein [Candidatus Binatia bacterium]
MPFRSDRVGAALRRSNRGYVNGLAKFRGVWFLSGKEAVKRGILEGATKKAFPWLYEKSGAGQHETPTPEPPAAPPLTASPLVPAPVPDWEI